MAAGAGVSHELIAAALGITRPTLRRYYRQELSHGAAARRMEMLEALHEAAMRGSVTAIKALFATWRRSRSQH